MQPKQNGTVSNSGNVINYVGDKSGLPHVDPGLSL